jgi:hypothetical protein
MARAAVLGGGSLNPFGGTGVDFGAFDITNADRESNLILTRVEVAWNAGRASDAEYLAALKAYAGTLTANTSQRLDADARVEQMTYRVEREVLAAKVDGGTATTQDLLAYDRGKLDGLNQDSEEYRQRLNTLQSTQSRYYSELEHDVVQTYNDGQMTTSALNAWYQARSVDPDLAGNPDITKSIDDRLHELSGRVIDERDALALDDYQKGKTNGPTFIAYATNARARFQPGTNDYKTWSDRISDAQDRTIETALLYRYDLSQQYAELAKFVASSSAPKGGTSTSKSTRTVLGADGKWHTVTTTSTKATGPSVAEQKAYHQRQIEVADAKQQMAQIAAKVAGVGGFTATDTVIGYYQKQLGKFAKGSDEWYAVQGKLDQLNDRKHAETVLAKEGIRISYPATSSPSSAAPSTAKGATTSSTAKTSVGSTAKSDTANVGIDAFMKALAHVESGGSYTARNKQTGAFGKYQIMPANWPSWAAKYLGNAAAAQTPENQEKVAKGRILDFYKQLGDWRAVAHAWLTGPNKDSNLNPSGWSASSTKYVDNVMAGLGLGPTSGSSLKAAATGPAGGVKAPPAAASGPLQVLTGYRRTAGPDSESEAVTVRTKFPTNMDSQAFVKFYAQYSAAFKSGATEFSIDNGNGVVHYFIGDDAVERRDGMRELDSLRISLFQERMVSYAGTPSEVTAAGQFNSAIQDAAAHEVMILDSYEKAGVSRGEPRDSATPIASGLEMLDQTLAGIKAHLDAADAALKRGELTTAYTQRQMAADLAASSSVTIAQFALAGAGDIAAIERAYGVKAAEALGTGGASKLEADLKRLNEWGTEIDKLMLDPKVVESGTLLDNVIKKDSAGKPMFDNTTADGQLDLADNWHWELKGDGSVEPVQSPAGGYDTTSGAQTHAIVGMIPIDYVNGDTTVKAYTKWDTGTVGWMIGADGKRTAIQGKVIRKRQPDGTDEMWVEDPFHPGLWSSTPVTYKTPVGFKAVQGQSGGVVFEFAGINPTGGFQGQATPDGWTYHLEFDPKTGTYVAYRSKPKGLFSDAVEEPLGSLEQGSFQGNAFDTAGFQRDLTGLTPDQVKFAKLGAPFVGGTVQQYRRWVAATVSPFMHKQVNERQQNLDEQRKAREIRAAGVTSPVVDPQSLYAAEHGLAPTFPSGTSDPTSLYSVERNYALKPLSTGPTTQPPTTTTLPPMVPLKVSTRPNPLPEAQRQALIAETAGRIKLAEAQAAAAAKVRAAAAKKAKAAALLPKATSTLSRTGHAAGTGNLQ